MGGKSQMKVSQMMQLTRRALLASLAVTGALLGVAHAAERPWGVIMPFGSIVPESRGFQGVYNPWESEAVEEEQQQPSVQTPKRIKQGWQNIYRPRTSAEDELWPDSDKRDEKTPKRTFGDKSLSGEEQWPERRGSRQPYRSMERFRTPFGTFSPRIPPQPFVPYGSNNPSWQRF